jgi:hypothetical protein
MFFNLGFIFVNYVAKLNWHFGEILPLPYQICRIFVRHNDILCVICLQLKEQFTILEACGEM